MSDVPDFSKSSLMLNNGMDIPAIGNIRIPDNIVMSEHVKNSFEISLQNLCTDYIDLYLIQSPGVVATHKHSSNNVSLRSDAWRNMEKLYDEGRVNAIGVSNYSVKHMREFIANHTSIIPMVNQVEWSPSYHPTDLIRFCESHYIVMQAHTSLGGASYGNMGLLRNTVVNNIARHHSATPAQVLLAWSVQQNIGIIPQATYPQFMVENIELKFRLTSKEIEIMSNFEERMCSTDFETIR
ncbi:unnamed protein product [Leptidea sinapis]|uniref:NADP-dependent oxidoreductase domain-containing protein n=1 Tax=Leptidea sinapis TaxID=189913 RepID=A0A5E4QB33_9NEOP|nr:unnamed protein product [Leptidea sinapis]